MHCPKLPIQSNSIINLGLLRYRLNTKTYLVSDLNSIKYMEECRSKMVTGVASGNIVEPDKVRMELEGVVNSSRGLNFCWLDPMCSDTHKRPQVVIRPEVHSKWNFSNRHLKPIEQRNTIIAFKLKKKTCLHLSLKLFDMIFPHLYNTVTDMSTFRNVFIL